jgi:hypothetical protein
MSSRSTRFHGRSSPVGDHLVASAGLAGRSDRSDRDCEAGRSSASIALIGHHRCMTSSTGLAYKNGVVPLRSQWPESLAGRASTMSVGIAQQGAAHRPVHPLFRRRLLPGSWDRDAGAVGAAWLREMCAATPTHEASARLALSNATRAAGLAPAFIRTLCMRAILLIAPR